MKLFITVLCLVALSQAAILCPKDACASIKCSADLTATKCEATGGKLKTKAGFCQCCDMCVHQLGEGDDCTATMLLGAPATAECVGDMYCDYQMKQCAQPNCAMKRKSLEDQLAKKQLLGLTLPDCEDDGTYKGKQCKGSMCYCVDKKGTTIKGYDHHRWETSDKITCQCARDFSEYRSRGIIGRLFRCTDKGDYEYVQCHGSVCYCADRKTGKQRTDVGGVHITQKDTLKC